MAGWETYLNDTLNIPFNWFVCKDSKKLKWRDLTGPEKQKLFRNINISQVLPNHQKCGQISQLWKQFLTIIDMLSSHNPQLSKEQIQDAWTVFKTISHKACYTLHTCTCMACARIYTVVWKHFPLYSVRIRKAKWQDHQKLFQIYQSTRTWLLETNCKQK